MRVLENILMPTDFSPSARAALTHAIFLAGQFGAVLHVLHVVELHEEDPMHPAYHFPDSDEIYDRLRAIATSELQDLLAGEQFDTLRIREHQERAIAAAPAIVRFVEQENVDLVVMGTHGRRGLRRLLLGSVAEEVVRTAACPVLTLHRPMASRLSGRIVVAIDFSEPSRQALETARDLAGIYQARLDLIHVVEHPVYPQFYDPVLGSAQEYTLPRLVPKVEEGLRELVAVVGMADLEHELHVREGRAASTITDFAEEVEADLLVIATHGLSGLARVLLGSVAENVVRLASRPVLTVKAVAG